MLKRNLPVCLEILLVFAVFAVHGAWPVPDVNEPYYLGKAIHYWNPDWGRGDFFLESFDTHQAFYLVFGWLSLWLSPVVLAWTGRVAGWALLAWAWRRLSATLLPVGGFSVLSAALFVGLQERCPMAGEWVIGGVEAKGFAYVLVLLGLEAMVRGRWNAAWLRFGGASLFHVLVGGWSAIAAAVAWLSSRDRPRIAAMWPGLLGGFALSLFGLVPSLRLVGGADPQAARTANLIYVFERLPHHLDPACFHLAPFLGLTVVWVAWRWLWPADRRSRRLSAFIAGALVLAAAGGAIRLTKGYDPALAAGLLRFYWFRLADVAVPLGVAIAAPSLVVALWSARPRLARGLLAALVLAAAADLGACARQRLTAARPRADKWMEYRQWRDVCQWITASGQVPPDACFLTSRLAQTFKWYTGRAEVVTWKDIPQDAQSIVEWWRRLEDVHGPRSDDPAAVWFQPLALQGARRLRELGVKYHAGYVVTDAPGKKLPEGPGRVPRLELPAVYRNSAYIVYQLQE
jgi:hypothetical protein